MDSPSGDMANDAVNFDYEEMIANEIDDMEMEEQDNLSACCGAPIYNTFCSDCKEHAK